MNDWWLVSVVPSQVISHESDQLIFSLTFFTLFVVLLINSLSVIIVINLKRNNQKLEKIAYEDKITGYPNWDKFCIDAKEMLDKNKNVNYAVLAFDINKFRVLNDLFGHNTGDATLKSIAEIINKNMRSLETFARVTADRYINLMVYEDKEKTIERIKQLAGDVENIVKDYKIELAIGIYPIEEKTLSIEVLNDRANIARTVSKQQNHTFYSFFEEQNRIDILKEKDIENIMNDALDSHEFEVYLQPKYLLKTDGIIGAEALVRWNRRNVGLIPPNDFIPLFEKNGFIRKLDLYMFEQVCCLLSKWHQDKNFKMVPVSVNISRVHLSDNNLPQKLLTIMKQYQVDPEFLEFELTESAIYSDTENMKKMMKRIRSLGIHISIDDFGSGYSSLSTLKDLPIDVVKLDKSFFDNLLNDTRGQSIVGDIFSMSRKLGLTTVAEGIETADQVAFLKSTDCDIIQGYYYSRPVLVDEFEKLISV